MSSLDTLYNINLSVPVDLVLEPYTNVPGNIEVPLGFVPRAFKGDTDFKIYTDSAGAVQLTENTDYELTVTDSNYTAQADFNVYKSFKIVNPVHYDKNLWITSKVLGSYVNSKYIEGISQPGLFRNAIIDPGFLLWDKSTSITDPTNQTYFTNMWLAERSGGTPDQFIVSRDVILPDEHEPYICKIEVTSVGAGTKTSSIYQRINEKEKFKDQPLTLRARVNFPVGAEGYLWLDNGNEDFQKTFIGTGAEQDITLENVTFTTAMSFFNAAVRFSDDTIDSVLGDYYIIALQLFRSEITLPFEVKKEADIIHQAGYYYEIWSVPTLETRIQASLLTADIIDFDGKCSEKASIPTISVFGTEATDWNVRTLAGTPVGGFTLTFPSTLITGNFILRASQAAHGVGAMPYFTLDPPNGYIEFDSRI